MVKALMTPSMKHVFRNMYYISFFVYQYKSTNGTNMNKRYKFTRHGNAKGIPEIKIKYKILCF